MENNIEQARALKAHLALNVKSVVNSIDFYRKMLGIEPSKVRHGYAKFDVHNPPLNLTLNEGTFSDRGALSHLGIQVASTDDVLSMRQAWQERGLITRDEMKTNCCYAVQDKTWVSDPDGNQWEVFVVLEDNLAETSTCCGLGEAEQTDGKLKADSTSVSACSAQTTSASTSDEGSCGCGTSQPVEIVTSSCCSTAAAPVSVAR